MLAKEIESAQRLVRTDAYQMSVGEIVSMYERKELIINPEFQRLFRWDVGQKSRLIESLLLGIPLPPIFVFERDDGTWELVDGLQRISTILEFMGRLLGPDGRALPPSFMEATKYLPSLHNCVWEQTSAITDPPKSKQRPLDKSQQLAVRRGRIAIEILKRPSDENTKYDLFQRLNAGGTLANAQELRNCVALMINPEYFRRVKAAAEGKVFQEIIAATSDQIERQRHIEMAVRFLVHVEVPYDGRLDVESYIDEGLVQLAQSGNAKRAETLIGSTFQLLHDAVGKDVLRRISKGKYSGRVGLVGLEGIAVGVAKNLRLINQLGAAKAKSFVKRRAEGFWNQPECDDFTSPGLRGTVRIQRTVPFGSKWFRP